MINDATIAAARTLFACCSFEYLNKYSRSQMYGEKDMHNRNLWLYMLWAKSVMSRTNIGSETEGCVTREFADDVFQKAKCFCEICSCSETPVTPTPDCDIVAGLTVDAAIDASALIGTQNANEVDGFTIYVVTRLGGSAQPGSLYTYSTLGGWAFSTPAPGTIVDYSGFYYVQQSGLIWPTLLFPPINVNNNGGGNYELVSSYPFQATGSSRIAVVSMSVDGNSWTEVYNGVESDLATPYAITVSESDYAFVRVSYVVGACTYEFYNGTVTDNNPPASARSLQGDGQYVAAGQSSAGIDAFSSSWTMSMRYQYDDTGGLGFASREVRYDDGLSYFAIEVYNDQILLNGLVDNSGVLQITYGSGVDFTDQLWHTIVVTRNPSSFDDWSAGSVRVYVDGVLINPTVSSTPSYAPYATIPVSFNLSVFSSFVDEIYGCIHPASAAEVSTVFIPNQMQAFDSGWTRKYWYRIEETDTGNAIANDVSPAVPASTLSALTPGTISTNVDPLIS